MGPPCRNHDENGPRTGIRNCGRAYLEETDPFVLEQIDRLEHHRAYTGGRDTERVKSGSSVRLVGVVQGVIEVNLYRTYVRRC